jgi:hypothetical protein
VRHSSKTPNGSFLGDGPGTHLSSDRLSVKLAGYGIHAQAMRNTSLFQLAATVQPRTLARLLGLHITTAVDWVNKSGGVYANYWEQVLDDDAEDLDLLDPDAEALETGDDGIQTTCSTNSESFELRYTVNGGRPNELPSTNSAHL